MLRTVARWYQKQVYKECAKYGLLYEDLLLQENPDVERALKYIPKEELIARQRRITRAMDLSFKHEELPKEIQAVQDPGRSYLKPMMQEMRQLREEKEILNPPY